MLLDDYYDMWANIHHQSGFMRETLDAMEIVG